MRGLSEFTPPAAAAEYWPSFVDAVQRVHGKSVGWPAELDLGGLKFLEAAHIKDVLAFLRWAENPRDRVEPRTIFDRTHARPAGRHQRPGWRATPRRGLFNPFDHSFGERAGVEISVSSEHRRRLSAV